MRIKLRARFIIGTTVTLLPLVAVSIIVFVYAGSVSRFFDRTLAEVTKELGPVRTVQRTVSEATVILHDYLVSVEPSSIEAFRRADERIERTFSLLTQKGNFEQEEEYRFLEQAKNHWKLSAGLAETIFAGALDDPPAVARSYGKQFDIQVSEVLHNLDDLIRIAEDELRAVKNEAYAISHSMLYNMGALLLLGIGLGALSGISMVRSILSPVRELMEGTQRLAAKDLDYRIPVKSSDELGELALAFNSMAERLDRTYKVLNEMASRDDLTLLLNAREFHKRLQIEITRSDRYGHPLSLIFLDVDHFKSVNDSFGHQIGDEVLRAVARILAQRVRPTDHVARYGGEEFAVICPETGLKDAEIMAERIRVGFQDSVVYHAPQGPLSVSVSLGVSGFPETSSNEHNLLRDADKALYQAKDAGRNCTRVFTKLGEKE